MGKSDIEIIRKVKINPRLFEELYKRYRNQIYNYFWYRTGRQKEVAEDLMQETFLRAFLYLNRFKVKKHPYIAYLSTIAHNILVNYYRSKRMIPLSYLGEDFDAPVDIQRSLEKKIELENLWKTIQELPPLWKDILLMKYKRNMSIREIGRIVGKSENAVKLILSRARKKLIKHPRLQ
jgi:RNA polymerase sigma-70 factor (ECF subfamily)